MLSGALGYLQALSCLPRKWMIKNVLLSGSVSLLVFSALFALIYYQGDDLIAMILGLFSIKEQTGIIDTGIDWTSRILLWVMAFFSFKYLVLIIAGPFVAEVATKVKEEKAIESNFPVNQAGLIASGYRGIQLALRNAFKEITLTIILLVFGLVTGLIVITGPLIIAVQAYYLGYANLDIVFEKHLTAKESKQLIRKNRGLALVNGLGFLGLILIPVLGLFLAPAYSMAAATKSAMRLLR